MSTSSPVRPELRAEVVKRFLYRRKVHGASTEELRRAATEGIDRAARILTKLGVIWDELKRRGEDI